MSAGGPDDVPPLPLLLLLLELPIFGAGCGEATGDEHLSAAKAGLRKMQRGVSFGVLILPLDRRTQTEGSAPDTEKRQRDQLNETYCTYGGAKSAAG